MARSKIYTRTGDQGETSLADGSRTPKFDSRLDAYGTVDELNSHIGLLISVCKETDSLQTPSLFEHLTAIQNQLFRMGSQLACSSPQKREQLPAITPEAILQLENNIDELDSSLDPLTNFILPGGSVPAAQSHICRCVARRAERLILTLHQRDPLPEPLRVYANRLSDYFFTLARWLNKQMGQKDSPWMKE